MNKLRLEGFNNLTKSLSVNCHALCYARTSAHKRAWLAHLDAAFNAQRLAAILREVADTIGASVLNVARQDYEPEGASVTMLIADGPANEMSASESVVAHLDKSHVTVHTYPESHPDDGICTFRADIDVSTCGLIPPLKALDYLLSSFTPDVVTVDYRVRGFTRDVDGRKHFIDHPIHSVRDYIGADSARRFHMLDLNVPGERLFHTKMRRCERPIEARLFGDAAADLGRCELESIRGRLDQETDEIFHGRCFAAGRH